MRNHSYISGQLICNASFETLDSFFRESQLKHEIRHSLHFESGIYLKLSSDSDADLTFEKTDTNEFLIRGEANSRGNLIKLAEIVSSVFTAQKLKHRLELYSPDGKEFGYYHYDWAK